MHKKIIIAVVHDGGDPPEVQRLRQFPNATVIVQPHVEALCKQLHQIAQQELVEGYELPSPSQCRRPDFSGGVVRGLDADFASRLKFFRSIPPISLGSALSLSFRFKNFPASQVPVLKFNEMHWRRMFRGFQSPQQKRFGNMSSKMCGVEPGDLAMRSSTLLYRVLVLEGFYDANGIVECLVVLAEGKTYNTRSQTVLRSLKKGDVGITQGDQL
ncbi:hypothetical protein GQ600_13526 [Phytophthora cactorum]|nr:hypothetical protein GQ600_13526 [Phytophthora cactorum]